MFVFLAPLQFFGCDVYMRNFPITCLCMDFIEYARMLYLAYKIISPTIFFNERLVGRMK